MTVPLERGRPGIITLLVLTVSDDDSFRLLTQTQFLPNDSLSTTARARVLEAALQSPHEIADLSLMPNKEHLHLLRR